MYGSTPKKRPKSNSSKDPNFRPSNSSSSSSTITSLLVDSEPPPNLLPSKSDILPLFAIVAVAVAVAVACNFLVGLFNRPIKPFCDSNVEFDDSVSFSDSCEPCPSNGRCYKGQLECIQGYRKYGKLCVEDGDVNETANKLSEMVRNHLCEAYAQYKCDGTGTFWVSENDLKIMLEKSGLVQSSKVDDMKYIYIEEKTMEYSNRLFDKRTTIDGIKEFKCPDNLGDSYKSLTCRARHWLSKHFLYLIFCCALLVACTLLVSVIHRRLYLTNRAEQLYHQVCDILEENALASKSMSDREPWVVSSRLRDHLLSPRERKDSFLWNMVEELVELDSRVERYPKLVKGDSKVVWEWQVEGSLSSARRKKNASKEKIDVN